MAYGKSIELFLVNGTADSLITAELSNWNGKAIKLPRIELASCSRTDISQAGVYFLFCKEDDGADSVYIGEAENVKERLVQHLRDYQSEKEKFYWNTAVVFVGRDLNKALIRYLENRFVEIARSCKRYMVLTKNTYRNTVMKESQVAVVEEFVDAVLAHGRQRMVVHLRKSRTTLRWIKPFNFAIPFNYSEIRTPQVLNSSVPPDFGTAEINN